MNASEARQARLRTLALAPPHDVADLLERLPERPPHRVVKGPETGLVMVRGRVGGGGAPFNAGEATMSRCVVQLGTGEVGFGHALGRDVQQVENIAVVDALAQLEPFAEPIANALSVLAARREAAAAAYAAEVAATKVDFFTMARGDD